MTPDQHKQADMYRNWIIEVKQLILNCETTLKKIRSKNKSVQLIFFDQLQIAQSNELFKKYVDEQLTENKALLKKLKKEFEQL